MEAFYDYRVFGGDAVAEGLGAVGGWNAGRVQQIFAAPGNAVQWATIFSGGDFCVGLFRLFQREVAGQRDYAVQLGIKPLEAFQINVGEALGGELSGFDPARELSDGGKGNVFVACGEWARIGLAADESVTLWS